ncbi:MAG TPA: hypothetical protein DD979_03730 [Gammaproteobacteria bacterium]|nr:hypothetical protein [Gammaproteobacteria bacterium]
MTYLMSQIALYIIAAALLGLLVGWMLRSVKADEKSTLLAEEYEEKRRVSENYHQQELDEFAEKVKSLRAEVTRLETNNTALRKTIDQNNNALELAHDEISQLSWKLKESETFNRELQAAAGLSEEELDEDAQLEFDETVAEELVDLDKDTDPKNKRDNHSNTRDETIAEAADADGPVELTMSGLWSNIKNIVSKTPEKKS